MATTTERRLIVVDVKGSQAAVKHMRELQKAAKKVDTNISRMGKTLGSISNTMKAFIAYRATAYLGSLAGSFLESADSMTNMYARLDLVNDGMKTTTELMGELFDVADRSRGSIEAVSTLYTRLTAATKDLNVAQQDVMDFTELVSDTFILSGASAGEAASGVTQISQAMAKGKLDGDEFKSIMENNVYFAGLLAESLGVTRGELQKMSKSGDITTVKLLEMGSSIEEVREKMKTMPITISQAVTAMDNAWKRMIGSNNALSLAVGKSLKYIADQANEMVATFEKMSETDIETKFQEQRQVLDDLKIAYRDTVSTMEAMALGLRAANENVADPEWIKTYNTKMIAMGVTASNLIKRIEELRSKLGLGVAVPDAPVTPPPPPPKGKAQETAISLAKKFTEEQAKANRIIWEASDAYQSGAISLAAYNDIYSSFAENAGLVADDTNILNDALTELNGVTEGLRSPFEVLVDDMKRLDEIAVLLPDKIDQIREAQAKMAKGFEAKGDDGGTSFIDWGQQAENAIGGVTGAFIDMAISGKNSFDDFAKSFLINMAKMIAQQAILNALKGTTFGGFLGLATGGVVANGNVKPYASGGVVSSPTIFPMANGIGLMGEAGAEAILPLKRGKNGDLGVQMEGGGVGNVTINQNINGNGDRNLAMAVQQGAQKGYQMFLEDIKRNGPGRRNIGA